MSAGSTQHPGNANHLLVQSLSAVTDSPLLSLTRRIADCGCSLVDARVSTLVADVSLVLLARGTWDGIAKLESALERMDQTGDSAHLTWYRSRQQPTPSRLLPYMVEIIAGDRDGVLAEVVEFFARRSISIEQLTSTRYQAMQTGADMFQAQVTIGLPQDSHIAALREEFMELCDGLNLDAIMDPVKF